MKNPTMKQTTITVDERIHALARKHGINLSAVGRNAINRKVQQAEEEETVLQNLQKKEKKYFAELLPLEVDDIVLESDCNGG